MTCSILLHHVFRFFYAWTSFHFFTPDARHTSWLDQVEMARSGRVPAGAPPEPPAWSRRVRFPGRNLRANRAVHRRRHAIVAQLFGRAMTENHPSERAPARCAGAAHDMRGRYNLPQRRTCFATWVASNGGFKPPARSVEDRLYLCMKITFIFILRMASSAVKVECRLT